MLITVFNAMTKELATVSQASANASTVGMELIALSNIALSILVSCVTMKERVTSPQERVFAKTDFVAMLASFALVSLLWTQEISLNVLAMVLVWPLLGYVNVIRDTMGLTAGKRLVPSTMGMFATSTEIVFIPI